ncbi:uncharacterized protein LOC144112455 [Amblyomma americanum]
MAAPMPVSCVSSQESRADMKRVSWSHHATMTLIRLWEENLPALRACSRNARIYASISAELSAGLHGEGPYTSKQVRQKIDNLHKKYRKIKRTGTTTGSGGQDWPFYWHLHQFLGSLPMNDEMLIEENVEVPVVAEMPEDAELVSWGRLAFAENDATASEPLIGNEATKTSRLNTTAADVSNRALSSSADPGPSSISPARKRQSSSAVQQLLHFHSEESKRSLKAAKKNRKLQKKVVELLQESNNIQNKMVDMMGDFLAEKKK